MVVDTRLNHKSNTIWRRRQCVGEERHRMSTIETPGAVAPTSRRSRAEQRKRDDLRRQAREEAAETGVSVQDLYEKWGVA